MTNERKQRLLCVIADDTGKYYYNGPLDGIWGPESQKAAERFMKDFSGDSAADNNVGDNAAAEDSSNVASFWDGIRYFKRSEPGIACRCGKCGGFPVEPHERLMLNADAVRAHFGRPMVPSSTVRCDAHNASLPGSAANSLHKRGKAMDFAIPGVSSGSIVDYAWSLPDVDECYAIDDSYVHMGVLKYK